MSEAAAVARLFVAIPLARPVARSLSKLRPPPSETVRPVAEVDLHVTLHFLGTRAIESVRRALQSVKALPFVTRLDMTGRFSLRSGKQVLWVRVEPVPALIALHDQSAAALAAVGFEPEHRPYRPHITLARVATGAPASIVDQFADLPMPGGPVEIECRAFALLASETGSDSARYRILERYPLLGGAGRRSIG